MAMDCPCKNCAKREAVYCVCHHHPADIVVCEKCDLKKECMTYRWKNREVIV